MSRSIRTAAMLASFMFLAACGTLTEMELDTSATELTRYAHNGNLQAEVDALAGLLVKQGETPGIVVGVLLPDHTMRFFGYGIVKQGLNDTPDGDTIFPIGSLSKGFLGAITAMLVQESVLSWNDTLGDLLPAETTLSPDAKKITLLQLATHTSGLPRQPFTFQTFRYFVQFLFTGENFYRHFDNDFVFAYLSDFTAQPQSEPQYSNLGYGLLGHVIERHTGLSLEVLLDQKLLRPLGLKNTSYLPADLPGYASRAHGHAGDQPKFIARGEPVPDWQFTELMKGSAGIYSSARDLLTFASAHLTDLKTGKTSLNAALTDTLQIRFPRPRDAPAVAWVVDDVNGQHIVYQIGLVAGYTSYIGLDVERHSAVVVLQNSFNWKGKVGHKLLARMAQAQNPQKR